MNIRIIAVIALLAGLPGLADAATSTSAFRVGITIEHDCRVNRAPDGGETVSLSCDADAASRTAVRTLAAGAAFPRANLSVEGAPMRIREVGDNDTTRMVVVEY